MSSVRNPPTERPAAVLPLQDAHRRRTMPLMETANGTPPPDGETPAELARQARAHGEASRRADLVVSLGSTLSVYPAASFPLAAANRGVPYIIINRGATDHDGQKSVSLRIEGEIAEIFPTAVEAACLERRTRSGSKGRDDHDEG